MKRQSKIMLGLLAASLAVAACARDSDDSGAPSSAATATQPGVAQQVTPAPVSVNSALASTLSDVAQELPPVVVYKSPSCGCCGLWVEHLRAAGFVVDVRNTDNLNPIKESAGIPAGKGSCHTAQVGDYFVEGHVPASDIKRLLHEKPDAKGLVLPGMPMGSPGMETPDGRTQPYTVELVSRDGSTSAFEEH